jgi:membrane protein implicated in regulation of membrane protease activity
MYYAALAKLPGFIETAGELLLRRYIVIPAVIVLLVSLAGETDALIWISRGVMAFVYVLFSLWVVRGYLRKREKIEREREEQAGVSATVEEHG